VGASSSSFPGNGARKLDVFCWRLVDVGASSSSFPGNGARKLDGGTVMMVPENLLACS
jgi:hypothetical protein